MAEGVSKHRKLFAFGLLQLLFAPVIFGQGQGTQQPPTTIQEQLTKTVGFITVPYQNEAGMTLSVSGTCFFVQVPDERLGKDQSFMYTVTNRHVATAEGVAPKTLLPGVIINVNRSSHGSGSAFSQVPIPFNASVHWYFPTDDTVDLAVLPVAPAPSSFDINEIPVSIFATNDVVKSEQINIGDSVVFIGFFFQFPGITRVEPIYRQGVIAMMPDDPIPMKDKPDEKSGTPEHLYLADAHAFHGNSGSPLFVQAGGMRNGSLLLGSKFQLIGVVNGFIPERTDIRATGAATFESSNEPNSGILTFVPAQELKDFLYSAELQKMRDEAVAAKHKP